MSTDTRSAWPRRWILFRDIASFVAGWILTFYEVLQPSVRESVLVLAGTCIAAPGALAGVTALTAGRRSGTDGSPSDSPASASSSSPS